MMASSGKRAVNAGAMAGLIGMTYGSEAGGTSSMRRKRASASATPACLASRVRPVTSGS